MYIYTYVKSNDCVNMYVCKQCVRTANDWHGKQTSAVTTSTTEGIWDAELPLRENLSQRKEFRKKTVYTKVQFCAYDICKIYI